MKKLLFLLSLVIFLAGCAKDGNEPSNGQQTEEGGIVLTSEVVQISVQDATNDTYQADIDGNPLNLDKVNDTILVFYVSPELPLGDVVLTVEDLNLTVNYTIQETVLAKTVEETMQEYISKLQTASIDITDSLQSIQVQETVSSFISYYNSLSPDDQLAVAEFYQANRTLLETSIDGIFKTSAFNKKLNSSSNFNENVAKCESGKFKTAVLAVITLGLAKSGAGVKLSVLTGAAATYSLVKTIGYCKEVVGSKIQSIYLKAEELLSEVEKNQNDIEMNDETSKFIPISLANRGFQSSDRNDSDAFISSVVRLIDGFNYEVLAKLNAAITKWNEKVPSFFSIKTYNLITIPDNASVEEFGLTQELFDNIDFTIPSNNIEIQTLNFVNGGISLKLRIVDPNIVSNSFLETTLDFTYNDDYNNFSGSFPLKVTKADPCLNNNPPVITGFSTPCDPARPNVFIALVDFEADGVGFDPSGSYFGSLGNNSYSYPVRVEFLHSSSWSLAANGYDAKLLSGDFNNGTIEIEIGLTGSYCEPNQTTNNQGNFHDGFRVFLVDDCGLQSNYENFQITMYW